MESIVGENNTGTNISVQKDIHRSLIITFFPRICTLIIDVKVYILWSLQHTVHIL